MSYLVGLHIWEDIPTFWGGREGVAVKLIFTGIEIKSLIKNISPYRKVNSIPFLIWESPLTS